MNNPFQDLLERVEAARVSGFDTFCMYVGRVVVFSFSAFILFGIVAYLIRKFSEARETLQEMDRRIDAANERVLGDPDVLPIHRGTSEGDSVA